MKRFTYIDVETGSKIFTINAKDILIADEFFEENLGRKAATPNVAVLVEEIKD